jgi:hypothetical protein
MTTSRHDGDRPTLPDRVIRWVVGVAAVGVGVGVVAGIWTGAPVKFGPVQIFVVVLFAAALLALSAAPSGWLDRRRFGRTLAARIFGCGVLAVVMIVVPLFFAKIPTAWALVDSSLLLVAAALVLAQTFPIDVREALLGVAILLLGVAALLLGVGALWSSDAVAGVAGLLAEDAVPGDALFGAATLLTGDIVIGHLLVAFGVVGLSAELGNASDKDVWTVFGLRCFARSPMWPSVGRPVRIRCRLLRSR